MKRWLTLVWLLWLGVVGGLLLVVGVVVWIGTPAWNSAPAPVPPALREAWAGRTLTLRPDACVELLTDRGRRAFVFRDGRWRDCPTPPTRRGGP